MASRQHARNWSRQHQADPWVREAKRRGFPSRATFKLEEVAARYHLLRKGIKVLDLGSSPGGWTKFVAEAIGSGGRVVAVDRLNMKVPEGVCFIRGDLTDEKVQDEALKALGGYADLVICDMAPNLTGIRDVDALNETNLTQLSMKLVGMSLREGGGFLCKTFMGEAGLTLQRLMKSRFCSIQSIKPRASRTKSKEFYILGQGFKGGFESDDPR